MVEQGGYQRKLEGIEWGKDTSAGISLRQEGKMTFFFFRKGVKMEWIVMIKIVTLSFSFHLSSKI